MVHHDSIRDLDVPFLAQSVSTRRFQEEERFSRCSVVQLFDVSSIVPSDSNNLLSFEAVSELEWEGEESECSVPSSLVSRIEMRSTLVQLCKEMKV